MRKAEQMLGDYDFNLNHEVEKSIIKLMKAYAKQVSEKVRQDCADNAKSIIKDWCPKNGCISEVDKQSILNTQITLE